MCSILFPPRIFNQAPDGKDKTAFLNANYAVWQDSIDVGAGNATGEWTTLLRTSLELEIALFWSAFDK